MKKRLLSRAILLFFLVSVIVFFVTVVIINHNNETAAEREVINYTHILKRQYEAGEHDKLITEVKKVDPDIRVTVIDSDGVVLGDSFSDEITENHLDRPEIRNLGKTYIRYSNTYKKTYLYYATLLDDGNYLRIALSFKYYQMNLYLFLTLLALFIASGVILYFMLDKQIGTTIAPLNEQIEELSSIAGYKGGEFEEDEIIKLTNQVAYIHQILKSNLEAIKTEAEKVNYIVDALPLGVIVLNNKGEIKQINEYGKKLFNYSANITEYLYLSRVEEFNNLIKESLEKKASMQADCLLDNKIYNVSTKVITNEWLNEGLVVIVSDIDLVKRLEKAKRDFFANASHELKSPLTSIIGLQEMIENNFVSSKEEFEDINKRTISEARRSMKLINDMLSLAELESLKAKPMDQEVDLKVLVLDVLKSLDVKIKAKGLKVVVDLEDAILKGSLEDFRKLVENLIDNAIKYNKEQGLIKVAIKEGKDEIALSVEDTGIGIKQKEQKKIYERFYRVDKGRSQEVEGTGLGLAIVKYVVLAYDARIELDSTLGLGSKFTVYFKKA
ncbi:MAG TPA: ATP-binding protein [Bacilli bacterium]|jgi:two-component system phosphate regulon sensor histidine kinase PhoR|nr:GHKL domain-containing protein [Bacilli bacterium]HQM18303.1 ATP-binding protein [Bacilli bacterium]